MDKLKNPLIALAVVATLVNFALLAGTLMAPLVPTVVAETDKEKAPRKFYLTTTGHNGAQALSACAFGYHMASVWEIFDPSNLRYNTEFGLTQDDSGSGPPTGSTANGWIRTGAPAALGVSNPSLPGRVNCNAWTVGTNAGSGSVARFSSNWNVEGVRLIAGDDAGDCDALFKVWCVQD
jgi:hypothetical protein